MQHARYASRSRRLTAATARLTTSTFSCDIAYAVSRLGQRCSVRWRLSEFVISSAQLRKAEGLLPQPAGFEGFPSRIVNPCCRSAPIGPVWVYATASRESRGKRR